MCVEHDDAAPDRQAIIQAAEQQTVNFIAQRLGSPLRITVEDRLKGCLSEAAMWIRMGAPARALEALERGMAL